MFFHRLVIFLRSSLFFQFWSRLVHKIEWPILLRTLDSMVFQECWLSRVCKPCIWKELQSKRGAFGSLHPLFVLLKNWSFFRSLLIGRLIWDNLFDLKQRDFCNGLVYRTRKEYRCEAEKEERRIAYMIISFIEDSL